MGGAIMRQGSAVVLLVGSIALLGACTTMPPAKIKPLSSAEQAERPVWLVGDRWAYVAPGGAQTVHEVVGKQGEHYVLRTGEGAERYLTEALGLRTLSLRGEIVDEFTPAVGYFEWPLEVGKPWKIDCMCKQKTGTFRVAAEVRVETYEEITVPAGTFRAFRIYYRDGFGRPPFIYWYAPAVKNWVRWEDHREGTLWELASFQPAKRP